jgi:antitoxin component YwqK of YwqJK toxin-antitoxin module
MSSEGWFVNGQPDGFWKTYSESGILISSGKRSNGVIDSTWKFFDAKGRIEKEINYAGGKKNGMESIYDSLGIKLESTTYLNNQKEGIKTLYYSNGKIHWVIPFVANKEEGKAKEYSSEGMLMGITKYTLGFISSVERFNRYNRNGEKEGIWKEFFPESELVFREGNYSSGKRNGLFQYYDKKGIVIRTETYENDVLVTDDGGAGNLTFKVDTVSEGVIARGGYAGNQRQGVFHVEHVSGEKIINQVYQMGKKVAEGKLDNEGMRQGIWKEYFLSGELKAEGEYKDNQRVGEWKYFDNREVHRRESFSRGKLDGEYTEWDTAGTVILQGNYSDGLKVGIWKYQLNDHLEEGEYLDGEKNGVWKWYYFNTDQPAFEGEFNLGIPRGKHRMWYPNGNLMEKGDYEGGLREGDWIYYNELGEQRLVVTYQAGEMVKVDGVKVLPKGM